MRNEVRKGKIFERESFIVYRPISQNNLRHGPITSNRINSTRDKVSHNTMLAHMFYLLSSEFCRRLYSCTMTVKVYNTPIRKDFLSA